MLSVCVCLFRARTASNAARRQRGVNDSGSFFRSARYIIQMFTLPHPNSCCIRYVLCCRYIEPPKAAESTFVACNDEPGRLTAKRKKRQQKNTCICTGCWIYYSSTLHCVHCEWQIRPVFFLCAALIMASSVRRWDS